VRARVVRARAAQAARGAGCGIAGPTNASIPLRQLHGRRWLAADVRAFLRHAIDRLSLSPRAYERVIRVARTIADLEAAAEVSLRHVAEALQYRTLDRGAATLGTDAG
jgi:magnesium chelatase family protein